MDCNYCGSGNCESNHIDLNAIEAMDLPLWLRAGASVSARVWNADRPHWTCGECGNRF